MTRKPFLGLVFGVYVGASVTLIAQATRDEVRKVEDAFVQARAKGDKAAYASLLADEFSWTTRTGTIINKKQQVDGLQATPNPESGKEIRVYGDAAVVIGTATLTQDGKPVTARFVRVWAKRDGRWQAVLHQGTTIPR